MPAVAFEAVDIVFGDQPQDGAAAARPGPQPRSDPGRDRPGAGCGRLHAGGRARRDLRAHGPVRLRQVDAAARRERAQHGGPRLGQGRGRRAAGRRRHLRPAACCGACACNGSPWCSSSSRCCPGARWPRTSRSASSCAAWPRPSATASSWRSSRWCISRSGPASSRTSFPAACSSASASPAPSPPTPTSC